MPIVPVAESSDVASVVTAASAEPVGSRVLVGYSVVVASVVVIAVSFSSIF